MTTREATAIAEDLHAIAAVLGGDSSAFATLVRRYNQVIFRACRAVLGNDSDAEDAVQVAWINAYRALSSFRGDSIFRTWLTRIAVNEASSRLRHRQRDHAIPIADSVSDDANPARDLQTSELGRLLERRLDELPEGLRRVIVLRDVLELDTAETAVCLGINEDNVRVRLHRARQALAATLSRSVLEHAPANVWRFAGDRCARVFVHVMATVGTDSIRM